MARSPAKIDIQRLDRRMAATEAAPSATKWFSPKESPFRLDGFAWFHQDGAYRRLPVHPKHQLPEAVDSLANCTAGGQIHFKTDSTRLAIKVRLLAPASMVHMPATGQCGFDCYLGLPGRERFCGVTKYDVQSPSYECLLFEKLRRTLRCVTLNFPLYQGVKDVSIGLDDDASVQPPPPYADDRPVVFYGTSIIQGGCASRPGMAHSNILSRLLKREVLNLGFSGNGKGEPEVARILAEIRHPALFILDYEGNCPSTEHLARTLPEFIRILRVAHPLVPIQVVSRFPYAIELHDPSARSGRLERQRVQREAVASLRKAGDRLLFFLDGSDLIGPDFHECTVDGCHPTDLGFHRLAHNLAPVLRNSIKAAGF